MTNDVLYLELNLIHELYRQPSNIIMAITESNKKAFYFFFHRFMYYLPRLVCLSLGSKTPATLLDSRLESRNIVYPFYSWNQTTFFSILFYSLDSFPLCILETHNHPTFSAIFFLKNDATSLTYITYTRVLCAT